MTRRITVKFRKLVIAAAIVLSAGAVTVPAVMSTTHAAASGGDDWCDTHVQCLNAWGGGPFVKSYALGSANNLFTVIGNYGDCNGGYTTSTCPGNGIGAGWPIVNIEYTAGGTWSGKCVGDAYNDPNRADASLNPCYTGWGVNFVDEYQGGGCPSGTALFYDIHWGGVTYWNPDSSGSAVYLNSRPGYCLHIPAGY